MRVSGKVVWGLVAVAAFAVTAACSGGNDSNGGDPNPGGPSGGGGGGGGTTGTTITITSSGVSPKSLTVARGTRHVGIDGQPAPRTVVVRKLDPVPVTRPPRLGRAGIADKQQL